MNIGVKVSGEEGYSTKPLQAAVWGGCTGAAQGVEALGAMWGAEKTREYLEKAGFKSIRTHSLAHDPVNNGYVVTKWTGGFYDRCRPTTRCSGRCAAVDGER